MVDTNNYIGPTSDAVLTRIGATPDDIRGAAMERGGV